MTIGEGGRAVLYYNCIGREHSKLDFVDPTEPTRAMSEGKIGVCHCCLQNGVQYNPHNLSSPTQSPGRLEDANGGKPPK